MNKNSQFVKSQMSKLPPNKNKNIELVPSSFKLNYSSLYESNSISSDKGMNVPEGAYQLSLKLETTTELEKKLRERISRYDCLTDMDIALSDRWCNLMEALEKEEDLLEEFKEIIVLLKLRGYNV